MENKAAPPSNGTSRKAPLGSYFSENGLSLALFVGIVVGFGY